MIGRELCTSTYIVKGGSIGRRVILEEVAGDGCIFDDIRRCSSSRSSSSSMSIGHDDND